MISQAIRTIRTLLPSTGSVTMEQIENAVAIVLSIPVYSDLERDLLLREIQSVYNIRMDDFSIIESDERRKPWLTDKKVSIWPQGKVTFWTRYRDYLQIEKNYADSVINQLDRLTDRTLDSLFDPTINAKIGKYGLVVGQVQSGKTSNYTGLLCKAADSGFKLIIVLAGIHNNLRSQTQLRIDEGFLGFDTQHQRAFNQDNIWLGVGKIDQKTIAHSLTSSLDKGDFSSGAANSLGINFNTNEPIIAVVKKNGRVLERLLNWLKAQAVEIDGKRIIRNKSLLLIDDEADNASINTRPENDGTTRINGLIRDIIRLFDKIGYVGYTATPFANIFMPIVEDELFPRDFIVNIPAPSNYIGPDKVFGFHLLEDDEESDTVLPIVKKINDYTQFVPNGHRSADQLPTEVPDSLKLAIKSFILTCSIRIARGQENVHNSMLVHTSRFVAWQRAIKELVENVFNFYRRGVEMKVPHIIKELRDVFETDSADYKSYCTISNQILNSGLKDIDHNIQVHIWEEIEPHIFNACSKISVREINGGSADALNYFDHKNGISVIAIGGDKLSRGLTLEGLSVSYYLRASRMYDTLMQMGRWFGYRPGYVDLCRLFTSRELNEWFCHITMASEELRSEFDYMSDIAGSTPEQYALRVRTHPGVLQISAANKIRRAVNVDVSWAGRLVESYEFKKDNEILESNLKAFKEFALTLSGVPEEVKGNYLWKNIQVETVKQFLQSIKLSESLKAADPSNLIRFIDAQLSNNELTNWTVAIMSKNSSEQKEDVETQSKPIKIGYYLRNCDDKNSNKDIYYLKKSHIISPSHEFIDLTNEQYNLAKKRTKLLWESKGKEGEPNYPNGEIVRNEFRNPDNPLLLLYLLDPKGAHTEDDEELIVTPILGYAISFPSSRYSVSVSYAVHEQLLSIFNSEDSLDEIEVEDEED